MSDLRMEKLSNAFFILVGSVVYTVLSGLEIYNFLCCDSLAYYLIVTEIIFIAIRFLLFVFVILFRVFTCYSTKYEWVYKIYLVMILIGELVIRSQDKLHRILCEFKVWMKLRIKLDDMVNWVLYLKLQVICIIKIYNSQNKNLLIS